MKIRPTELVVRNAAVEDLPAIVEIYNSTIPAALSTADTVPVTLSSRRKWFEKHRPESRPLLVLEYDNTICGWLSFQSFYGRPAYVHTAEISIYIREPHRKQGLGRFLLQKGLAACPGINVKTLLGFILGHNEPSLRLFKSFGFEVWGRLPGVAELSGTERELVIMGKRVG